MEGVTKIRSPRSVCASLKYDEEGGRGGPLAKENVLRGGAEPHPIRAPPALCHAEGEEHLSEGGEKSGRGGAESIIVGTSCPAPVVVVVAVVVVVVAVAAVAATAATATATAARGRVERLFVA